ncbi:MAG: HepT-like ribonuclease domain-containing protein [Steroidobacter sp.]
MQSATNRIARFTKDKSFSDYEVDDLLRSAVERQFEVTGEASTDSGASTLTRRRRLLNFQESSPFETC